MTELPAPVLTNPLSGEILDPADHEQLRAAQQELEEWLGHDDVQRLPIWRASREIEKLLPPEPYGVPARSRQTSTQQKLERCPKCSTVLEIVK